MFPNVGTADRVIRVVIGLAMILLALSVRRRHGSAGLAWCLW